MHVGPLPRTASSCNNSFDGAASTAITAGGTFAQMRTSSTSFSCTTTNHRDGNTTEREHTTPRKNLRFSESSSDHCSPNTLKLMPRSSSSRYRSMSAEMLQRTAAALANLSNALECSVNRSSRRRHSMVKTHFEGLAQPRWDVGEGGRERGDSTASADTPGSGYAHFRENLSARSAVSDRTPRCSTDASMSFTPSRSSGSSLQYRESNASIVSSAHGAFAPMHNHAESSSSEGATVVLSKAKLRGSTTGGMVGPHRTRDISPNVSAGTSQRVFRWSSSGSMGTNAVKADQHKMYVRRSCSGGVNTGLSDTRTRTTSRSRGRNTPIRTSSRGNTASRHQQRDMNTPSRKVYCDRGRANAAAVGKNTTTTPGSPCGSRRPRFSNNHLHNYKYEPQQQHQQLQQRVSLLWRRISAPPSATASTTLLQQKGNRRSATLNKQFQPATAIAPTNSSLSSTTTRAASSSSTTSGNGASRLPCQYNSVTPHRLSHQFQKQQQQQHQNDSSSTSSSAGSQVHPQQCAPHFSKRTLLLGRPRSDLTADLPSSTTVLNSCTVVAAAAGEETNTLTMNSTGAIFCSF